MTSQMIKGAVVRAVAGTISWLSGYFSSLNLLSRRYIHQ